MLRCWMFCAQVATNYAKQLWQTCRIESRRHLTFERCGRTLETNGIVCFASFGCQMNAWRLFEPNDGAMRR
ncbi:MAG: hypothetical protein ACTS80_00520 [Candidatus Hodgkinia cicadicola]